VFHGDQSYPDSVTAFLSSGYVRKGKNLQPRAGHSSEDEGVGASLMEVNATVLWSRRCWGNESDVISEELSVHPFFRKKQLF